MNQETHEKADSLRFSIKEVKSILKTVAVLKEKAEITKIINVSGANNYHHVQVPVTVSKTVIILVESEYNTKLASLEKEYSELKP